MLFDFAFNEKIPPFYRQTISRDKLVQFISVQISPHVLDLSQSTIHCLKAYEFRYRRVTFGFH